MQVVFNKPIKLGTITFQKGTHEVPADLTVGWFFEALLKDKVISIVSDSVEVKASEPVAPKTTVFTAPEVELQGEVLEDDSLEPLEDLESSPKTVKVKSKKKKG